MRIDAITSCSGDVYTPQLKKSLPIWLDTLDSLVIVTRPDDEALSLDTGQSNLRIVTTEVFTDYGAYFNKGAGLCVAYGKLEPIDWCLHFDSDIIPPKNWRAVASQKARPDCLNGAYRYDEGGARMDEAPLYPYGYFHLWHTSAPQTWRWPIFDVCYPHAGSYDANFTDLWPRPKRKDLGFRLVHQGERRANWFGTKSGETGTQKMAEIKKIGYRKVRVSGIGKLKLPEPQFKFQLQKPNASWARDVLRACALAGPFAVVAGTDAIPGAEKITPKTAHTVVLEKILGKISA